MIGNVLGNGEIMNYYLKRFIALIVTLFFVAVLCFVAFQIIPGDSAELMLGMNADEEAVEALREAMGLNRNVFVRFFSWIGNALCGDFGVSSQYGIPVTELLGERLKVTVWLAVIAIGMIVVVAIPLGLLASKKENGVLDRVITLTTQTLMAVPPFFLGIVLTLCFGVILKLFVPGACPKPSDGVVPLVQYLMWPAIAVAIPKIAMVVKFLRSSLIRELKLDYVRTAKSKGNSNRAVLWRHVLKNALMPVITFMGMVIADVLAGSIIVEQVFNLPGMGKSLILAIANRDFNVVQTIVLYIAVLVIVMNFIVDILYKKLDPRID